MPGGNSAGAKAVGRFYRNASFSLSTSLAQISLDADAASVTAADVERSSGDMKTLEAGAAVAYFQMQGTCIALLTGFNIVMTRSPGTAREYEFVNVVRRANTSGSFAVDASGMVDVDVDDTIRIEVAALGIALTLSPSTGENNTWAHMLIT